MPKAFYTSISLTISWIRRPIHSPDHHFSDQRHHGFFVDTRNTLFSVFVSRVSKKKFYTHNLTVSYSLFQVLKVQKAFSRKKKMAAKIMWPEFYLYDFLGIVDVCWFFKNQCCPSTRTRDVAIQWDSADSFNLYLSH